MFSRPGCLLAALWACHSPHHAADYQLLERGPHSRTWQRQELDDTGQLVTHPYVQYETGLHYWDQGQWLESVPQFEVFKDFISEALGKRATLGP